MATIEHAPGADAALRRRTFGWLMFDWATQPFYTLILTFVFGPYFAATAAEHFLAVGLEREAAGARAQSLWTLGQTLTGVAIALTAPFLGALADTSGRRIPWIAAFSLLYVAGTAGLWTLAPDGAALWLALGAFGLAMIGAEFTTIFSNAILPSLGGPERVGRVSGTGYAVGYAGGLASLVLMLAFLAENEAGTTLLGNPPALGLDPDAREGTRAVGPLAAIWFAVFMVPFFAFVRDDPAARAPASAAAAWADLKASLAAALRRRSLGAFLLSSMLYRDALVALYGVGGVYAALVLGWEVTQIGAFGVLSVIVAGLATFVGGRIDGALGPRPVISACIWTLSIATLAVLGLTRVSLWGVPLPPGSPVPDAMLYAFGAVVGGAGGVLQASSRSMMVRHADPARPTEAFGLYALSGKATAFLAPALVSIATWITQSPRLGIAPIALLFLAGLVLLRWVRPEGDAPR